MDLSVLLCVVVMLFDVSPIREVVCKTIRKNGGCISNVGIRS